jgi:hypothetical protein
VGGSERQVHVPANFLVEKQSSVISGLENETTLNILEKLKLPTTVQDNNVDI